MITKTLSCSHCLANNRQNIARGKVGPECFRNVLVVRHIAASTYQCRCLVCGHEWKSKAAEAHSLFVEKLA